MYEVNDYNSRYCSTYNLKEINNNNFQFLIAEHKIKQFDIVDLRDGHMGHRGR